MTAPVTNIGAAQDGLLALLKARSGLSAISVDLGWPWQTPNASHVWIEGDVPVWRVEELTTGLGVRERMEYFELPVRCVAQFSSNDYVTTRNVALAFVNEVELAVRGDRTLSGSVADSEVAGGHITEVKFDDGRGRGVLFQLLVACQAPIVG